MSGRRRPRSAQALNVQHVCDALNHLSGSTVRVRLAGVAGVARDLQELGRLALAAAHGPDPETSLAILVTGLERARHRIDRLVRRLADLPAAGGAP